MKQPTFYRDGTPSEETPGMFMAADGSNCQLRFTLNGWYEVWTPASYLEASLRALDYDGACDEMKEKFKDNFWREIDRVEKILRTKPANEKIDIYLPDDDGDIDWSVPSGTVFRLK